MTKVIFPNFVESFATTDYSTIPNVLPIITMEQTHAAVFKEISDPASHCVLGVDAIWTRQSSIQLVVRAADCAPILFYLDCGIVGVIHAGRRGTQAEITKSTLQAIQAATAPHHQLHCWIGPHICENCYEINPDSHQHVDLLNENIAQIKAIFPQAEIISQGECTLETPTWHSYRREGPGQPMNYFGIRLI